MNTLRRLAGWSLALAALLVLGAATVPSVPSLLDAGDAAFARGDYAGAVPFYEQALDRTDDPTEAAFRLASAKYRLAVATDDRGEVLAQAQQLYRCCLGAGEPRRAEALLGLGSCLLLADAGAGAGLREALDCFERCLRLAPTDSALADAARSNREKARLLLLQITPPSGQKPEQDPPNTDNREPKPPEQQPMPGHKNDQRSEGSEDPSGMAGALQPLPGQQPRQTDRAPPPGKGNLSPIPDQANSAPSTAKEAVAELEQAAQRIATEHETHRRDRRGQPAAGVRDW